MIVHSSRNPIILNEALFNRDTKWQSDLKNFYKNNGITLKSNYDKDSELYIYLKDSGSHVYKSKLADNAYIMFPLRETEQKYVEKENPYNDPEYFKEEIDNINSIIEEEYKKHLKIKNHKILRYYLMDYEGNPATPFAVVSDDFGIAEFQLKYDSVKSYYRVNQ